MRESLSNAFCEPCSLGTPPLEGDALDVLYTEIDQTWQLENNLVLVRKFKFKDFKEALEFVNRVGEIAEAQGHHPDIELGWGRVIVRLTTHKIHGLSRNDFIMASRIDAL